MQDMNSVRPHRCLDYGHTPATWRAPARRAIRPRCGQIGGSITAGMVTRLIRTQFAAEIKADLVFISEQYQSRTPASWYADLSSTASTWVQDGPKLRGGLSKFGV